MRQKRAKAYRKLMHVYSMSFGFRQPYQVLGTSTFAPLCQLRINELVTTVDSEMCKSALGQNLNLVKQLHAVLQGEVKPSGCLLSIHKTG
jgi:U3 small nucleolar RNA-associated protein 23